MSMKMQTTVSRRALSCGTFLLLFFGLTAHAFAQGFEYKVENQKSNTDGDGPVLILEATDFIEKGSLELSGGVSKKVKLKKMSPGKQPGRTCPGRPSSRHHHQPGSSP